MSLLKSTAGVARGEFGIAEPETASTEERQGFRFSGGYDDDSFDL